MEEEPEESGNESSWDSLLLLVGFELLVLVGGLLVVASGSGLPVIVVKWLVRVVCQSVWWHGYNICLVLFYVLPVLLNVLNYMCCG